MQRFHFLFLMSRFLLLWFQRSRLKRIGHLALLSRGAGWPVHRFEVRVGPSFLCSDFPQSFLLWNRCCCPVVSIAVLFTNLLTMTLRYLRPRFGEYVRRVGPWGCGRPFRLRIVLVCHRNQDSYSLSHKMHGLNRAHSPTIRVVVPRCKLSQASFVI